MNTLLWVVQGGLALVFVGAGAMKLTRGHAGLAADPKTDWAAAYTPGFIMLLSLAEIAGAIGLIVPMAIGVAPILTPLAALGLAVLMSGATRTHVLRSEVPQAVFTLVIIGLCGFVAWGRWPA